ncbi:hypothetical protein, partial [Pseudomonas sp. C11]|uniref:hypothetical protein n=1 Tax=Pseudomonas sp. C11 TaxID=3075550 RepID=UPI002AFF51FD
SSDLTLDTVARPGGRNQKHQQKRGNSELTPEQPTLNCQSGIKSDAHHFATAIKNPGKSRGSG